MTSTIEHPRRAQRHWPAGVITVVSLSLLALVIVGAPTPMTLLTLIAMLVGIPVLVLVAVVPTILEFTTVHAPNAGTSRTRGRTRR